MLNHLLFIYGTLLNSDNEFGRYLQSNSTFYSDGKFKGRLYDIGEYPGAVTGTDRDYDVKGGIYQLNSPDVLKLIDDYEGYGDEQDEPFLYLREKLPIVTPDGVVECWVYLYNHPLEGLIEIKSGDYQYYHKQKKR